jgi:NAD(P)-dependent dehydrogenase (short-subunit alcohol dehydrogenase family)
MMKTLFDPQSLAGQTVLVTGASSGLGRDVARMLASLGARVIASGRNEQRLADTMSQLRPGEHVAEIGALDSADAAAEWLKAVVGRHGALTGIFHGAGVELVRPIRLTKSAQIDELFASSTFAALGLARAAAAKGAMVDGGAMVFMSSVAGQRGTAGMVGYSAAKAAIDGMVRSLAAEMAPRAIRVNALAAGAVVTEMHERLVATLGEAGLKDYEHRHLLGFGKPEDVSNAAAFLFSDASRWITGTTLTVDGGYLVR